MQSELFAPLLAVNVVSIVLIFASAWWPKLTRLLFTLIFGSAGLFNIYTAIKSPSAYQYFGELAVLDSYRRFISGTFFAEHAREVVSAIALGQIAVAALLCCANRLLSIGAVGGVVFFIGIMPLGIGSAFPMPVFLIIALVVLWWRLSHQA